MKYEDFLKRAETLIGKVKNELIRPLSDEPTELEKQMRNIEKYYGYCQYLLGYADYFLDIAQASKLPEKEKGLTEMEREIKLDESVAKERLVRNLLRNLIKGIEIRIAVCQSSLKYQVSIGMSKGAE